MAENKKFWDKEGFDLTKEVIRPFEAETKSLEAMLDRYAVLERLVEALNEKTYRDVLLRRCKGHAEETVGYIIREYVRLRTNLLDCARTGREMLAGREHTDKKVNPNHDFSELLRDLQLEQNELK